MHNSQSTNYLQSCKLAVLKNRPGPKEDQNLLVSDRCLLNTGQFILEKAALEHQILAL